jgi:hypothetical protein
MPLSGEAIPWRPTPDYADLEESYRAAAHTLRRLSVADGGSPNSHWYWTENRPGSQNPNG